MSREALHVDQQSIQEWQQALEGNPQVRAQWTPDPPSQCTWQSDGVLVNRGNVEWANFSWHRQPNSILAELKNLVIAVTVSGKAAAAGLSFGHYKDFLVGLDRNNGPKHLQLEVDVTAGRWAFRVDGQLQNRNWWDAEVHNVHDLVNGLLTFKTRAAEQVLFQDFSIYLLDASCQLSIIVTCYRFQQRLRVSLRNWCHQSLPSGAYEVLVVNPESPDGTHEYLAAVAKCYPHIRVREVKVDAKLATNKAAMINRAFQASRGEWIWLTDADCLFSPMAAEKALAQVKGKASNLFYGQRRFLTSSQTSELLAGRMDGLHDFETLCLNIGPRAPENEPWGYTQIVSRSTLERIPYREQVNHFAHSDSLFIQDCRRRRILPVPVEGLFCLHLDHPFAWYGTNAFL